jgi:DNA-binding response OmpR family regulator
VQSAPLAGSTFEILLPAVRGPAETIDGPALHGIAATGGHETVLLVDEDDVVNKMVAGILTADGYRVLTAPEASAARREVRRTKQAVQLLIASFGAAGGENEKLARSLRAGRAGLRVLNTGTTDSPSLAWLKPSHQARLPKPFALSELLKAARKLLDTAAR